ncbi:hypothetical protein O1L68_43545 [Streptomyces lydicus]|nr:hypothetical protein [Streptomyces lydicus]
MRRTGPGGNFPALAYQEHLCELAASPGPAAGPIHCHSHETVAALTRCGLSLPDIGSPLIERCWDFLDSNLERTASR